jgi:hypothetical protein
MLEHRLMCACLPLIHDCYCIRKQVGTEVERANDLVRSALRCVAAISYLEDIEVRSAADQQQKLVL